MKATKQTLKNEHGNAGKLKRRASPVETFYNHFFKPSPSPLWQSEDGNFTLEQPHFLKIVPTETVYIFPALTQLNSTPNA